MIRLNRLICKVFGHRPAFGWCRNEGAGYFKMELGPVDGVGRQHADLYTDCERCGTHYRVGKTHLPTKEEMAKADPYNEKL